MQLLLYISKPIIEEQLQRTGHKIIYGLCISFTAKSNFTIIHWTIGWLIFILFVLQTIWCHKRLKNHFRFLSLFSPWPSLSSVRRFKTLMIDIHPNFKTLSHKTYQDTDSSLLLVYCHCQIYFSNALELSYYLKHTSNFQLHVSVFHVINYRSSDVVDFATLATLPFLFLTVQASFLSFRRSLRHVSSLMSLEILARAILPSY